MRVRALDGDGDMQFGRSQRDFLQDVPEAVAQCVVTRLRLDLGAWFLDTTDGTNWATGVLGPRTRATRDPVIRERILGTEGVARITGYTSSTDADTRTVRINAAVSTVYGAVEVVLPLATP